jgi:hypothetical protein
MLAIDSIDWHFQERSHIYVQMRMQSHQHIEHLSENKQRHDLVESYEHVYDAYKVGNGIMCIIQHCFNID